MQQLRAIMAKSESLVFGRDRRSLPQLLEPLIFSFLAVDDWPSLFFCSHSLSNRVQGFLANLSAIPDSAPGISEKQEEIGFCLAARNCRSLRHLRLPFSLRRLHRPDGSLIQELITANSHCVQTIEDWSPCDESELLWLTSCPRLRVLHISSDSHLSTDTIKMLSTKTWPHLSELTLRSDHALSMLCQGWLFPKFSHLRAVRLSIDFTNAGKRR